jgi:hypothetical protein
MKARDFHDTDRELPPAARAINVAFHEAYDAARGGEDDEPPIFLVLADELVVLRGGARQSVVYSPPAFHLIKAVVHAPVALFSAVLNGAAPGDLCDRLEAARGQLHLVGQPPMRARLDAILDATATLAREPDVSRERLDRFARELGPLLLASTDDAVVLQLEALDDHVARLVSELDDRDRARFEVVVAGAHQARARSLGMQYFGRLVNDPSRVTYAENVDDEAAALQLVRTRRLDQVIATAFFAEPERLERDVLGDSVKAQLASWTLRAKL